MNCVLRKCVYALLGTFMSVSCFSAIAKDDVTNIDPAEQFHWESHAKLSWEDFKGDVNTTHAESAAATYCSIGFKTSIDSTGKQGIQVYNTFYTNKSWVRPDAKIQSILDHEQGHFDLCEIYTRKLRSLMCNFDLAMPNAKQELMRVYAEISQQYESRQQAYEQQTTHGTNIPAQKRWQMIIAGELMQSQPQPMVAFASASSL